MSNQITITNFFKDRVGIRKILDYVEQKLIEQGKRSVNDKGQCKYRGEDGCKCGVGHLIPDSRYDPVFDSGIVGVHRLVNDFDRELDINIPISHMDKNSHIYAYKMEFLRSLQIAHDHCVDPVKFKDDIRKEFARLRSRFVFNLTM